MEQRMILTRQIAVVLFLVVLAIFSRAATAPAAPEEESLLRAAHEQNQARLENSIFGLPLYLDSFVQENLVQVDVHGILGEPFAELAEALANPINWCEIVFLHPNTKACTSTETPQGSRLVFYLGRKHYQPPHESNQVSYRFQVVARRETYLDILLLAEDGPFGTRNHRIAVQALPLDQERSFVRVSYSYASSLRLRLAEHAYFTTLGAGKVGFTVVGDDALGNPVHIDGARGAVERNAARYYFAIQAFMHALPAPTQDRLHLRLEHWYDLTDRYRKQLFELERDEYLEIKVREHENQRRLQRESRVPFL